MKLNHDLLEHMRTCPSIQVMDVQHTQGNFVELHHTFIRSKDFSSAALSIDRATELRREQSRIKVGCNILAGEDPSSKFCET